jgi:hypothetical protein
MASTGTDEGMFRCLVAFVAYANCLSSHTSDLLEPGVSQSHSGDGDGIIEELDNIRYREIKAKAISGILILLTKWFKRSRKF